MSVLGLRERGDGLKDHLVEKKSAKNKKIFGSDGYYKKNTYLCVCVYINTYIHTYVYIQWTQNMEGMG
jgi:hypothetical protein